MIGLKINEIFKSLQGEGSETGQPTIFIRLSGCNLTCSFCDTNHKDFKIMNNYEIIEEILQLDSDPSYIVITGGEPLLQKEDLQPLVIELSKLCKVGIETNGTVLINEILRDLLKVITISPKQVNDILKENLEYATEIKVIDNEFRDYHLEIIPRQYKEKISIQTETNPKDTLQQFQERLKKTANFCINHNYRMSWQSHKFIGVL